MTDTAAIARAFETIYRADSWSHGSGPGSRPVNTIAYRAFLERFIAENRVATVTELGCGDWQFSRLIDWSGVTYTGFDVVESVITRNLARYWRDTVDFRLLTRIEDLPGGDLLLAKEVLQHLPLGVIRAYLPVIRSRYRFALITNTDKPEDGLNGEIEPGGYRPLRLDRPPFDLPGAVVLTYCPQTETGMWRNSVFLTFGTGGGNPA
ncbi:glycosyltransferase sugar-binding region containing DXD motif [Methylobacterium sp. 4-46]|uniref:class I SAM-dependent methyltransferase n=1 Tax=unclassified Methylobacterium TaxID=2615210 RepID=UPI000165C9DD|nr:MULTISPECIES: class I SAM-dependent methyltransferase [Methylobacterium]ACA17879.1 glycosyltransferase sugar-binding region containing DXD motif [Methylobacterium sp. 4-46]WFT77180.1 class I SAM-dependent methyltransferase [Methylobacterium nodulans]